MANTDFEHMDYSYDTTNKPRDSSFSIGNFPSSKIHSGQFSNLRQYNTQY